MSSGQLWIPDDEDEQEITDMTPLCGVCIGCGCTDEQACEGGCVWATPAANLCSRCAPGLDHE